MSDQFYPLTVSKVTQETKDAVSLTFDIPSDLKDTFQYKHGQYLTLRFFFSMAVKYVVPIRFPVVQMLMQRLLFPSRE